MVTSIQDLAEQNSRLLKLTKEAMETTQGDLPERLNNRLLEFYKMLLDEESVLYAGNSLSFHASTLWLYQSTASNSAISEIIMRCMSLVSAESSLIGRKKCCLISYTTLFSVLVYALIRFYLAAISKRSSVITLTHAVTKSLTNFCFASSDA